MGKSGLFLLDTNCYFSIRIARRNLRLFNLPTSTVFVDNAALNLNLLSLCWWIVENFRRDLGLILDEPIIGVSV